MSTPTPLTQLDLSDLRERTSIKWRAFAPDVLPLWVAEMDAHPAAPVVEAVTRAMRRGDTGYCAGSGAYREALADFAQRTWGWSGPASGRVAIVPDVMLGVVEMLRLVTRPGEAVVVNPPVYPPFYAFVTSMDRRPVQAPLGSDGRLDLEVLERVFAEVTAGGAGAAFLLCSPHNPTGTVHTAEELSVMAGLARRHGVRVVVDEIHAPLVHAPHTFVPYLSLEAAQDGLALMSASKAWNLAGLKAALAMAGEQAADDLARLPEEVGHGASHIAEIAHVAAYTDGRQWLGELMTDLGENRRLLGSLLREHLPAVGWQPPQATYLAWLDWRRLALDDPAEHLRRHGRVALTPGAAFGPRAGRWARLNFATSAPILTEAVQRMAEAVRGVDVLDA